MRIQNVRASRPDWYDRNPVTRAVNYFSAAVAPHADTTRWSYTVPAGKKFALQVLTQMIMRHTAAGALGLAYNYVGLIPNGGSLNVMQTVPMENNTVGTTNLASIGSTLVMLAGDAIAMLTTDTSTTGTIFYTGAMNGLEYDA